MWIYLKIAFELRNQLLLLKRIFSQKVRTGRPPVPFAYRTCRILRLLGAENPRKWFFTKKVIFCKKSDLLRKKWFFIKKGHFSVKSQFFGISHFFRFPASRRSRPRLRAGPGRGPGGQFIAKGDFSVKLNFLIKNYFFLKKSHLQKNHLFSKISLFWLFGTQKS